MIANAMQLYRNDPLTRSIVDVSATYLGESRPTAVTTGPDGKPNDDSKAFNQEATDWFNNFWWDQADARQRPGMDFGQIQKLFDKWCWVGGDQLFLLMDGRLMPYEGLQIQTPAKLRTDKQITNGIRLAKTAPYPISHYYLIEKGNGISTRQDFRRIRANEAIYAGAEGWRLSMLRSIPDLHGVIDALHKYMDTNDNVQRRIQFESMMWTKERKGAVGNLPGTRLIDRDSTKGTQVEHSKADWGMRLKVNGDPNDFILEQMKNPHSNYVPAMEHMARIIAAGTGFPYEIIMHIYTSGSYTANRAARLDFAKAIMNRWAWRNKVLNQRVWNWRIAKAIKQREIRPAPVDAKGRSQWYKCAWTLPHFPHIDEGKEVVADIKQWGVGQESLHDWAQNKGTTREGLLDQHDADIKAMQERAKGLGIPLETYMGQLFKGKPENTNANS
jgi:hypothetical protein